MIEDSCAAAAHHAFSKMQAADDISSAAMLGSLQSVKKPCAESGIPNNRTFAKQRSQRTLLSGPLGMQQMKHTQRRHRHDF